MLVNTSLIQRAAKIVMREIGGETVLIPISQTGLQIQRIFALNETATAIWKLLEVPMVLEQLCFRLSLEYDATPDRIRIDILPLLNELIETHILESKI